MYYFIRHVLLHTSCIVSCTIFHTSCIISNIIYYFVVYVFFHYSLRLVGHVIRMQSRCQTPLGTLLTTVPSNCHLRQGHGRTSTLQHNVADDLRSINCDVTSISVMTKSCFFNLVDTLD